MTTVDQFEEEMLLDKIFKKYQELYEAEGLSIKINNDFKYGYVLSMLHNVLTLRLTDRERKEEYEGMQDILDRLQKRIDGENKGK